MAYVPPFENSSAVVSRVAEIAELVGQVTVFDGLSPNPRLRRINSIRTVHSSLLIEGNALTLDQTMAVLDGKRVLAPPKDIREVQNAYEAYEAASEMDPYSLDDLLRAHGLMMSGLVKHAGSFRDGNVGVFDGDALVHAGTPARYVPEVMSDLFGWLQSSSDHPLVKGSVFHYEFEFVHPFADGNGRTGRLWHSLILRKWRPIFAWMPIETLIHEHQQEYYDALARATGEGSSTSFVEFMLEITRDALQDALRQQRGSGSGEQINDQIYERINERFGEQITERQRRIVHLMANNPSAVYDLIAETVGVSSATARRDVADLVKRGFVRREGARKNGHWEIDWRQG